MFKHIFLILAAVCAIGVLSKPQNPSTNVVGPVDLANNPDANQSDPVGFLLGTTETGVRIYILPNQSFAIGGLTLPPDTLCRDLTITTVFSCFVCSVDCSYVHNKWGGTCAYSSGFPNTTTTTGKNGGYCCVCNDSPQSGTGLDNTTYTNSAPTATQSCPSLTGNYATDRDVIVPILIAFLRYRYQGEQCMPVPNNVQPIAGLVLSKPAQTQGCGVDCYNNHQYWNGNCANQTAVYGQDSSGNYQSTSNITSYCYCNNNTQTAAPTSPPATTTTTLSSVGTISYGVANTATNIGNSLAGD